MTDYKAQITQFFAQHKEVHCPAFPQETIVLNAKGINHLIYKGNRSRREKARIETNIRLLPRAIKLLRLATLWQEESRYRQANVWHRFWCFEAVIDERRLKVIIRQVGRGQKHFWSVIPAWRRDRYGIINAKGRNLEK